MCSSDLRLNKQGYNIQPYVSIKIKKKKKKFNQGEVWIWGWWCRTKAIFSSRKMAADCGLVTHGFSGHPGDELQGGLKKRSRVGNYMECVDGSSLQVVLDRGCTT